MSLHLLKALVRGHRTAYLLPRCEVERHVLVMVATDGVSGHRTIRAIPRPGVSSGTPERQQSKARQSSRRSIARE